jgi:HlyD family secretion protein
MRRVDAQLAGSSLLREPDDPRTRTFEPKRSCSPMSGRTRNALAQERTVLDRARHDLAAAEEVKTKLVRVLPHYREQESAFERLARDGFAGRLMHSERQRERIEREQDLRSQEFLVAAAHATIAQSQSRLAQITADYRRQLQAERAEAAPQVARLREEIAKLGTARRCWNCARHNPES